MSKIWCALLVIMLLPLSVAIAEADSPIPEIGVVTELSVGTLYDLDGDGSADDVQLALTEDEYGDYMEFVLSVNGQNISGGGCNLNDRLYVLKLNEYSGTLLLVSEYGPSYDPLTRFYLYETGMLIPAGSIDAMPDSMRISGDVITAPVRGNVLYTWYHDADFVMARAVAYDDEGNAVPPAPTMCLVPRYTYPMGLTVTLKVDLPLQLTMTDEQISATLGAGSKAVLCASDDVKWVYIQDMDSQDCGWLELSGDFGFECIIDGVPTIATDVFDGLFLAD